MTSTPPLSTTDGEDRRIRRNVACVNCRNSKVRCKASNVYGQACQRCAKLSISCVVDKSHKRVTRRSKLEQLEQELKSIKQVVESGVPEDTSKRTPTSPLRSSIAAASYLGPVVLDAVPRPPTPSAEPPASLPLPEATRAPSSAKGRASPRSFDNQVVSGEDVEWYFEKFFTLYHPFVPILRLRDPDECYESDATLFWTIIYVACRRFAKDGVFFNALVSHVGKEIWASVPRASLALESIHAILLACTWPLPTNRFLNDPTNTLAGVAVNACLTFGFHMGPGPRSQFLVGPRVQARLTDEEAMSTWALCCVIAQRAATGAGLPAPSIQLSNVPCKKVLDSTKWKDLLFMLDVQMYINKTQANAHAQMLAQGGIASHSVQQWDEEFDSFRPFLPRQDTDLCYFVELASKLEVQAYYFCTPPSSSPNMDAHLATSKAFVTARSLICHALDLEKRAKFMAHGPFWVFRGVLDASCMLLWILHSTLAPDTAAHEADTLAQQGSRAVKLCSIREGDLPHRAAIILETYWSVRHLLPKVEGPPLAWSSRLGAPTTFSALRHFKARIEEAKNNSNGLETRPPPMVESVPGNGLALNHAPNPAIDIFQDIDWSMFASDFDWVYDENFVLST
ncbi:hypothetical protein B0I35DRAFT_435016 [Stachybotrys elegans]|uniref:Zn(2)-C6 fungal-type domain-containing protein n=1 Tax=Stachybotrys elegans TaxID=80388 RepID=A0A8K0SRQ7_9HYPO|nr:hypothetical protein B0I35DRAFT_435016 [Stachybotrys elegans]